MFEVQSLNGNNKYMVYDIKYDSAGFPHFLIYKDNQWLCKSAKHFKPVHKFKIIK